MARSDPDPKFRRNLFSALDLDRDPLEGLVQEELVQLFKLHPKFEPALQTAYTAVQKIALLYHAVYLDLFAKVPLYNKPIPPALVTHLANLLGEKVPDQFRYPETSSTFFLHAKTVRKALGWRNCTRKLWANVERWLANEAERTDDLEYLREALYVRLKTQRIMLPAAYRMERAVGKARTHAQELISTSIVSRLSPEQIEAIDNLRKLRSGARRTGLQWLKDPLGPASPKTLSVILDRIEAIRALKLVDKIFEKIHPDMRRRMRKVVEVYSVDSLWADFP